MLLVESPQRLAERVPLSVTIDVTGTGHAAAKGGQGAGQQFELLVPRPRCSGLVQGGRDLSEIHVQIAARQGLTVIVRFRLDHLVTH